MKITKFGHSCLLVEEGGARILLDPGSYSTLQNRVQNIDAILITHEHGDHFDPASLETVLRGSPGAKIYTNPGVQKKLAEAGVSADVLGDKQKIFVKGVAVEGWGVKHAFIYATLPVCDNVGFFIADRFFTPGDALTLPGRSVEIFACPIAAPWMKLSDVLDYGRAVAAKQVFPVHDAFLTAKNPYYPHAEREFSAVGSTWRILPIGEAVEF